jgi:hypothetical protein
MSSVNLYVANPDGQNSNVVTFDIMTPTVVPTITSISPTLTIPDNTITVNGSNFVSGAIVKFGTVLGTNVTFVSAAQLTVTVPNLTPGATSITVQNPSGAVSNSVNITIDTIPTPGPTTTLLDPATGIPGASITITGTGFVVGATVKFGTTLGTDITVVSATQITVKVPSISAGVVNVIVTNPDAQQSSPLSFTVTSPPPPTITSINPTSGPPGTVVTITGTGFTSNASVMFGTASGTFITVVSPTQITVTVPSAVARGLIELFVTTSSGRTSASFTTVSTLPNPLCRIVGDTVECYDLATNSWIVWKEQSPYPKETSQDVTNESVALLSQLLIEHQQRIHELELKLARLESNQLNSELMITLIKAGQANSKLLSQYGFR